MSFGVVYGDGKVEDLMKKADDVLYEAKEKRNTVVLLDCSSEQ
jgi:PleD family two-component response regulator